MEVIWIYGLCVNSNVKSVLLYWAEAWRMKKDITKKVQTFINSYLRNILRIHWPNKISNINLWHITQPQPVGDEIGRRRWGWIGYTLRKATTSITRQSLSWNPQGKQRRGRPRNTWRRDLQADTKKTGYTWNQLQAKPQNRRLWKTLVGGLYPRRDDGHKK